MAGRVPIHDTRPRSRYAAGLPAITAERIVDEALRLTEEHGLENWTLRQLAAAVEAYPAVVYHHVGDREAVAAAVLDRVAGMIPLPPAALPWRDWFRVLLGELRVVLRRYPGTARRLAARGPGVERAAPIADRGVALLREAGFGTESVLAHTTLLGTACQFIATEDDRGAEVHRADPAATGEFAHDIAEHPESVPGFFAGFYDYVVERTLDGMAARLARIRET
ncbi:TetR/AcrR family transcriptional regulator [Actinokineospora iranica]|uniref:Regulatory protein, tetR family n=1 Tax=Actinokineospora iranica TaxID=1271860 RepID=A0A1G6RZZ3_9PSEU|nr:TetR family transcriptional regulator [Actinokineospora iranica]SDD10240.1 regulatory protein, tetR family [Actinokineospora iranica]